MSDETITDDFANIAHDEANQEHEKVDQLRRDLEAAKAISDVNHDLLIKANERLDCALSEARQQKALAAMYQHTALMLFNCLFNATERTARQALSAKTRQALDDLRTCEYEV